MSERVEWKRVIPKVVDVEDCFGIWQVQSRKIGV